MDQTRQRIEQEIKNSPVVLFMKGTKTSPQCGFSAQVVHILKQHGVDFKDIDVLADWDLREGIKAYSNWPTIPQLYIAGEFIGGCDIATELNRKGELKTLLEKAKSGSHADQ